MPLNLRPLAFQRPLADPRLSDTIHLGLQSNQVAFGPGDQSGDVVLILGADDVPPPDAAVVTWTESDTAPFYCVEPWMGPPNAAEHKRGLHLVPPGLTQTFTVTARLRGSS